MKKEDVASLFVYAILLAGAIVFGLTVLQTRIAPSSLSGVAYGLYVFAAIVVGVIFNALLFELSHLIGAKLGGYEVLSFNVLYFCWAKHEGKFKFHFRGFNGLTGETKIAPKKDGKKPANPTWYLILSTILYIVEAIAFFTLFIVFTDAGKKAEPIPADIGYFLLIVGFVGLMLFLYNIMPFKLDSQNDGYRLTLVSNPKNKIAFNELLRVEKEIADGNKDVEIMTFDQITNFTADLNLNKVYLLLTDHKYEEAEPLIKAIMDSKESVSYNVYVDAVSQLVFIDYMKYDVEKANEEVTKLVDSELKRDISHANTMVSARAYILIEGLLDKSKSECIETINNIKNSFGRTQKARREIEIKLFNIALDKVIADHPNWEFDQYRLVEHVAKGKDKKVELEMKLGDEEETKDEEKKSE